MFFSKKSSSLTSHDLRDFSANRRLLLLVVMAVVVGTFGAGAAWLLQYLINLVTNLSTLAAQRQSRHYLQPSAGLDICSDPSGGGCRHRPDGTLRLGAIRGHGIPEAIEAILIGKAAFSPKVALPKPLSSAISIGTGGPFGAEGPIIMTGGAWLDLRAVVPYEFRRTKNPARRGRCGGYGPTLLTHRRHPAGCRVAALRMEAAELHS